MLQGNYTFKLVGAPPAPFMFRVDENSGLITLKYNIIDSEFAAYRNYRVSTRYRPGPEIIKLFSCSTQLSTKFHLLIKTKILTSKEVSCFKSLSLSAVGNVSGNRCESDCRSRGREFDPGPVPYFRGD